MFKLIVIGLAVVGLSAVLHIGYIAAILVVVVVAMFA